MSTFQATRGDLNKGDQNVNPEHLESGDYVGFSASVAGKETRLTMRLTNVGDISTETVTTVPADGVIVGQNGELLGNPYAKPRNFKQRGDKPSGLTWLGHLPPIDEAESVDPF